MMADDPFSRWLDIEVEKVKPGFVKLSMTVGPEMLNGFGVAHGGIAFSLADSALAFASNSHGKVSLALENNISFMRKLSEDDVLTATTEELSLGSRIGVYRVTVTRQDEKTVAIFRGTVFRTGEKHFPDRE